MVQLNINDYVKVKLTEGGYEVFNDYYNNLNLDPDDYLFIDDDGWLKIQLWTMMNIFGSSCYTGCFQLFEGNIVKIKESI